MADDLSLLLKIKGDAASGKAAVADTRAAITQLRNGVVSDFSTIKKTGEDALDGISEHLNLFVGERIPLVGGAFVRLSENLHGFGEEGKKSNAEIAKVSKTIDDLSATTGRSHAEISKFLAGFVNIKGEAARAEAAIKVFGGTTDAFTGQISAKFLPEIENAATELGTLSQSGAVATSSFAGMAGPVGLAVLGMLATVAAAGLLGEMLFKSAETTAEFEDKLFNLSRQLGISVETLSGLEILAKQSGLDVGELSASLGIFQRHLEQAQDPTSKSASLLKSLGIESTDTEEALRQTITTLARMPEGFRQTATALDLFGRSGKAILAILKQTDGDLDAAISKFREMGLIVSTEDAKAAHEFTDQMALLGFQMRAVSAVIGKEVIPAIIDLSHELSNALKENHQAIEDIGTVASVLAHLFTEPLKGAFYTIIGVSKSFHLTLDGLREAAITYALGLDQATASLVALHGEQGKSVPGFTGAATGVKSPEIEQQSQQADLNTIKNAATEAKQIATTQMQAIDELFERGQLRRREQIGRTIQVMRDLEASQQKDIQLQLDQLEVQKKTAVDTVAIDRKAADLRSQARQTRRQLDADVAKEQTKLEVDQTKQQIQQIHDRTENYKEFAAVQIQIAQQKAAAFQITDLQALAEIKKYTEARFAVEDAGLKKELGLVGKNEPDREKINQQLLKLDSERIKFRLDNEEKIRLAQKKTSDDEIERLKIRIDTDVRLSQIAADGSITSLKALATLRVKSEEETEREILKVRLAAKDRETEATRARITAAGAIADPRTRAQEEARLNGELRVLLAERTALEAQGARDIEDGHDRDIENERKYADTIIAIRQRVLDVERQFARDIVASMFEHHADRFEIIKAQIALDIASENEQHQRVENEITRLREANAKIKQTEEERLAKEREINRLQEAERKRHRLAMKDIEDQGKRDTALAGPAGGFLGGLQSGQLKQLTEGVANFKDIATVAFSAVGAAVNGLAQGVGQLVQNWVLMGSTGEHAMRKMVASVLAGVASQAATLAVFELAMGIAAASGLFGSLIYGSPLAHFKAAALFGSIALVAGVAGRAVAGDAFQSKPSGAGGSSGGSNSTSSGGQSSSPLLLGSQRDMEVIHLVIEHSPGKMFDSHVVSAVVKSGQGGGAVRQLVVKEIKRQE